MDVIQHVDSDKYRDFVKLLKSHQGHITFISDSDQAGKTKVEYQISWFDEIMIEANIWWTDRKLKKESKA